MGLIVTQDAIQDIEHAGHEALIDLVIRLKKRRQRFDHNSVQNCAAFHVVNISSNSTPHKKGIS